MSTDTLAVADEALSGGRWDEARAAYEAALAADGLHDPTAAEQAGARARVAGRDAGDFDLEMAGLSLAGLALVRQGRVGEGMRMLDEAAVAAAAGELGVHDVAGGICCDLIFACEHVHDFDRAGQWCLSTGESARHAGHPALFGVCRAHYASVLVHRGRWEEAEQELEAAAGLFERSGRGMAYEAVLRLAELRRRQGRYEEAERLCETVVWHPRAQLCLAATAFDEGRLDDAVRCLDAHPARPAGKRSSGAHPGAWPWRSRSALPPATQTARERQPKSSRSPRNRPGPCRS